MQMLQGVINRLSQNSFLLKGWCVVLISAFFAIAVGKADILFLCLAFFPSISFWILDGYFLWQEKMYRGLYDIVREKNNEEIDFSMDASIMKDTTNSWIDVTFSKTLLIFHGTVFGSIVIVMLTIIYIEKGR